MYGLDLRLVSTQSAMSPLSVDPIGQLYFMPLMERKIAEYSGLGSDSSHFGVNTLNFLQQ
jgi:hypothetical protein